jgi:hypothetical protein
MGAVVAAIALAAILIQFGRRPSPAAPPPAPPPAAILPADLAATSPPLGRSELIAAANAAAATYAAGLARPTGQSPIIGRRFSLSVPFACGGPRTAGAPAQAYAELDEAGKTLKLVARPILWTPLPLVQALPNAQSIEAVEGFWIPRPWTASEACPPVREKVLPATETPPTQQTLGLARYFRAGESRAIQRGERPYQFTLKVDSATPPSDQGYRLRLEGRLVGYADGRAIHCWSETADHRPICLYAVEYDRVAFEDTEGKTLAEWRQ